MSRLMINNAFDAIWYDSQTCPDMSQCLWCDLIRFLYMSRLVLKCIHDKISWKCLKFEQMADDHSLKKLFLGPLRRASGQKLFWTWNLNIPPKKVFMLYRLLNFWFLIARLARSDPRNSFVVREFRLWFT